MPWINLLLKQLVQNMPKNLIDTNLIIRFLLNDEPSKAAKVEKLLKSKESVNYILDTVIAEIVWVLSSFYNQSKADIIPKITALIHIESVECNTLLLSRALIIWQSNNISYIDAYLAAVAQLGDINLYSYDQKFKSISKITVKQP